MVSRDSSIRCSKLTWLRWFKAEHLLVVVEEHGQFTLGPRSSIFGSQLASLLLLRYCDLCLIWGDIFLECFVGAKWVRGFIWVTSDGDMRWQRYRFRNADRFCFRNVFLASVSQRELDLRQGIVSFSLELLGDLLRVRDR